MLIYYNVCEYNIYMDVNMFDILEYIKDKLQCLPNYEIIHLYNNSVSSSFKDVVMINFNYF